MAFEFKLPDIGEGVVEGEVVEWLVQVGDTVKEDQPLVAVMTDKATVEIPSPHPGKVLALGAKAGEIVKVGATLVTLDAPAAAKARDGNGDAAKPAASPAHAASRAPAHAQSHVPAPAAAAGPKAAPASAPRSAPATGPRPALVPAAAEAPAAAAAFTTAGPVLASPATRRRAREMGVDLQSVAGSGPRGRVTGADVEAAAGSPARPAHAPALALAPADAAAPALPLRARPVAPGSREEERIPLRGLRRRIAERMAESKRTAAHFSYVDECDVTDLVALREKLKPAAARYGVKLTYLPFIFKALVPCLRDFPLLNASLDEEKGEIVQKRYWNIGLATDTDQGLTVPVVHDVDSKSVLDIAAEMAQLTERARAGRLRMEDVTGGTFTVTSTGNVGGLFATPIINYPEVAILGVPKIRQRPVVRDGQVVVRDVLYLALSLDHRVVDGAVAARFLNELIEYLSDPARLLLELA